MNYRILLLLILTFWAADIYGQSAIKGRIIDSLNSKPVEFCNATIYNSAGNALLDGRLTDSTGLFEFKNLKAGLYYIKIESIGFKSKTIQNVSVDKSTATNLGDILIEEDEASLKEIIVNGQQQNPFKQVYKANQFEAAKGGTAIDVLKNMPSISVNAEGDIRLRGSLGFLILVNEKPVQSDLKTVLSQIPANAIENIEIITSPSAKYDADGKAGIINITTKKGMDDGISFTTNIQYGLPSVNDFSNKEKPTRYGIDGTLNYKKGKWDLSVGGSYQENDIAGRREGDVNTTIDNRYTYFPSVGERSFQRSNYSARALVAYSLNENNSFNVGFYTGQKVQYRRADITYHNTKWDVNTEQPLSSIDYFNSNLVKKQGNFSLANIDYSHKFKNKSVLTFSGLYEYAVLDGYTKNLNTGINNHADTLDYVLNTGNSPISGLRGKVDYSINIGKGKLESGYQARFQRQTGAYLYKNAILGTGQYSVVPEFSADIKVLNYIHSLYTQYSGKTDKLSYVAGLRYEYSFREFNADKITEPYKLDLSSLFPSLNLVYALNTSLRAKGGFSRRVQRSTSNELNPYPEREHSETLEQGDPRILPEFVNLSEIGLVKDLKNAGSVFITVYNQDIKNVVNRVNSAYNDTILNRIYTNAGRAYLWGIESGINIKPVKWWSAYLSGNIYNYRIKGKLFSNTVEVRNSAIAYSINTNHNFQFSKTVSLQFNLNYLSERPTAQGEDSRFISPNLSLKKTFLEGRLSASLQWQNIGLGAIKSNEQRITTRGVNFYTTTNYIQEKDVFLINISYSLSQASKKVKLPSSEFGEKEF
ncbi:TonB-dependent receptor [Sporocytophaga myxococcoides]|uniref:TonB-dependent receptor n=1 Tax=Sporocytophaga myxococcoides TaxID=153721 RepID=UPI00041A656A|nr:TonB-dependent receptor [Sporocytophaga myxococcoides]